MSGDVQRTRTVVVLSALALGFAVLGFRLCQVHLWLRNQLQDEAVANHERVLHRMGRRGQIFDATGNLLASSISVRTVTADPKVTGPQASVIAQKLSPLLRVDAVTLTAKLSGEGRYVRLQRKVSEEVSQQIRLLKIKGIEFEDQFERSYPNGALASHVLGFVNAEHKGVQGMEASMEEVLKGWSGYEIIQRDRKGREIRADRIEKIGPRDGRNLVLTLDLVIQHIAETELERAMVEHRPKAGVIIVSRPKTGEILAMSCRPTFDPNKAGEAAAEARRNRCISDVAEPGSTFKVVVVAGALNEGIVKLSDQFNCENGAFLYAGRVLHDAHPYGVLSVEEILFHSSNIGASKVALRMGPSRVADYVQRFGFGRKTGITLPGEVSGIAHPLSKWTQLSITRIPMGHEIAATPLQMLMAVNAVANGGRLMKPLLVRRITDDTGRTEVCSPQMAGQCIAPQTSGWMAMALRKVVSPSGTAAKAAVAGYDVAGKTGTAQKIENGQYVRKYYSSFIGYLPASDPEISILVSLDDPVGGAYYGGTVAGPVFRAVTEKVTQYLGLPPQTKETIQQIASVS